MRATCSGCTGLLVFDSTGCVPEWCATSVQMIEYAPNIHVYPNPFSSVVSVGSDVPIAAVKIFDYSGVLLHQSNNTKNINLSLLASGLYIMEIESNNGKQYVKVIKQ